MSTEFSAWYTLDGPEQDVILSTRARLVRNLADFMFVSKMTEDDKSTINSLVYDAFMEQEDFSYVNYSDLSRESIRILQDKNVLKTNSSFKPSAIVLCQDDKTSVTVNQTDHIRIFSFSSGLQTEQVMQKVYKIDEMLQEKLQFSASFKFGYLASRIKDCGTGLKFTIRIFVPSIVLSGNFEAVIQLIKEKGLCIQPVFKPGDKADFSNCLFDIFPGNSRGGTEIDQMAAIQAIGQIICKTERKIRADFADNNPTVVHNFVKRCYAKAMYSTLITYEEGVDLICGIKWGLESKILSGISENLLNALFYRIKDGHLSYLSKSNNFTYEEDVKKSSALQIQRLRAIIFQQTFEDIKF